MSDPAKEIRIVNGDKSLNDRLDEIEDRQDAHEQRIVRLEKFQSFVFGAAAAIGAVAGYLLKWLRGEQ